MGNNKFTPSFTKIYGYQPQFRCPVCGEEDTQTAWNIATISEFGKSSIVSIGEGYGNNDLDQDVRESEYCCPLCGRDSMGDSILDFTADMKRDEQLHTTAGVGMVEGNMNKVSKGLATAFAEHSVQGILNGTYLYSTRISGDAQDSGFFITTAFEEVVTQCIKQIAEDALNEDVYYETIGEALPYLLNCEGYGASWVDIQTNVEAQYTKVLEDM